MSIGPAYIIGSATLASGSSAELEIPVSTANNPGDAIIIAGGGATTSMGISASDPVGNSYSELAQNTSGLLAFLGAALDTAVLTTAIEDITVTYPNTVAHNAFAIGCPGVSYIDQANMSNGTSAAPSVSTGSLAAASELAVAVLTSSNSSGAPSNWGGGFTQLGSPLHLTSGQWVTVATQVVTSNAALTASASIMSAPWAMAIATFRASGAGGLFPVLASVL